MLQIPLKLSAVIQLVKKFHGLMELENPSTCSQNVATGPCPEPAKSKPHLDTLFVITF